MPPNPDETATSLAPAGAEDGSTESRSRSKNRDSKDKGKGKAKETPLSTPGGIKNDEEVSKWATLNGWIRSRDLHLDNKGSVARDHLANERTFLAWTRTSLSLASIGVAITQLFRLSSSTYTLPDSSPNNYTSTSSISLANSPSSLPSISEADLTDVVANLLVALQDQQAKLEALGTSAARERSRYAKLGKPIGGTFIGLGVLFLLLGAHRYLSVQHQLATKNQFPPARRSVLLASSTIGMLLIAAFTSILVIH